MSKMKVTWTTTEHHETEVDAAEWAELDADEDGQAQDSFLADLEGNDTFQWCERDDIEADEIEGGDDDA